MGQGEVERIKKHFSSLNLHPTYLEHEEVRTSEEASKVRGCLLKEGIKSMVFTNGEDSVLVNLPANQKINVKAVRKTTGWSKKKTRMANEEEVIKITGCVPGSVPPFGHKTKLRILLDKKVFDNKTNSFNIGLKTHSAKVPTKEMKVLFESIRAEVGEFMKNQ